MRRVLAVLTVVGALVALPACGGKTDEKVRAAGITPANALAFLTLSLDPAIEQKKNLLSIARAFPGAKVKDEFESAREDALKRLLEGTGLDYQTDVEPWLGNEIAIAALPAATPDAPPFGAVFIAANNAEKAEAALAKAQQKAGSNMQHRFIDGYEVLVSSVGTEGTAALDAIETAAKGDTGGLAEAPAFSEAVAELHGDRLMLGWVDSERAMNAVKNAGGSALAPQFSFANSFANAKPVAFDLHAADKAIVLEAATRSTVQSKGGEPRLAESLPAATIAALTAFDVGGSLRQALDQIGGAGGDDPAQAFKEATGLDLQADVLSWMSGEITTAVGPPPAGEEIPDFALVIEVTDRAKATAAIPHIREAILRQAGEGRFKQQTIAGVTADVVSEPLEGGVQPSMALFADRFVIASRPAYLTQVATKAPDTLGSSAPYRSVFESGTSGKTLFQLVVRLDPLREVLEKVFGMHDDPEYLKDTKPNLVPLDVLGARAYKLGEFDRFELKLTVS